MHRSSLTKTAFDYQHLHTLGVVAVHARSGGPVLHPDTFRESPLPVQVAHLDAGAVAGLPLHGFAEKRLMVASRTCILLQFYEYHATLARERRVAKTLRVEQMTAAAPVTVLVGKHAIKNQNFLAGRVIMSGESRTGVIAHDGGN